MRNQNCEQFLQWALPQLHMRWSGFCKVRHQVCKRLQKRIHDLSLSDLGAYQQYLLTHPEEWVLLDNYCRISISKFYRDKKVFDIIAQEILPGIANQVLANQETVIRSWSAGCAGGEEAYTLSMIWRMHLEKIFPDLKFCVLATDSDANQLRRAQAACYLASCVKDLPEEFLRLCFTQKQESYCLNSEYQQSVEFRLHDVREPPPHEAFHLILCRNLVFTYYTESLQLNILQQLHNSLAHNGALIIGAHELLPTSQTLFQFSHRSLGIYKKSAS